MITANVQAYANSKTASLPKLVKPEELAEALKGEKIMAHIASSEIRELKGLLSELRLNLWDYAYPGEYTGRRTPEELKDQSRDSIRRASIALGIGADQ